MGLFKFLGETLSEMLGIADGIARALTGYRCTICGEEFHDLEEAQIHVRKHTP